MRIELCLNPSFDTPAWRSWLDQLPQTAATIPREQMLQAARNHVFRAEFAGQRLVVKRFFNRGAWKKLAYRISSSKARRSYDYSLRLLEAGLQSPQPIAWREDWRGSWLEESYYVCEYVAFAHEARLLKDIATPEVESKAALVGLEIGRMHEAGILHLDLTPGNLLFLDTGGSQWKLSVVDNNRMRFGAVSTVRGIGSLLQLGMSGTPLDVAIEAYARARGIDPDECRRRYAARLQRFQFKWRLKNATRPWRRKLGL